MTGRRPPRGPADKPWRGGRPGERGDAPGPGGSRDRAAPGDQPARIVHAVELEELAVQPVGRRPGSRPGIAGVAAVLVVAGLLAGGFGLLGGRPGPTPSGGPRPSAAAVAPSGTFAAFTPAPPTPAVTPYTDCGPEPAATPIISLQTNGVPSPGLVEIIDPGAEPTPIPALPTPADPLELLRGPRVEVRPDVITELWIDGAACALRWGIGLYDPLADEIFMIEQVEIDGAVDRRVAAQNRFNLSEAFAPHRALGHDIQLIGSFEFEGLAVVAWWRVAVLPLDLPSAALWNVDTGAEIPVVAGCPAELRLANGYGEIVDDCEGDLSEELGSEASVAVGERLRLDFDGVPADDLVVTCGHLSGLDFVAEPEPGCRDEVRSGGPIMLPDVPGSWTVAMSGCASVDADSAGVFNSLCGTWYASVRIVKASSG